MMLTVKEKEFPNQYSCEDLLLLIHAEQNQLPTA